MAKIYIDDGKGGKRLLTSQDLGLNKQSLGKFFGAAIARRKLTVEDVSTASGISHQDIESLIEGKKRFDKKTIRQLQTIFPHTKQSLTNMQKKVDAIEARNSAGLAATI